MSMDLKIIENVQKLTWNFDEMKTELAKHVKQYANLVVNEENLPGMEKTHKEIAALRVKLSKFRLAVKKDFIKPYEQFELEVKQLLELVEDAEKPIKDQIEKYEDMRREDMHKKVQQQINDIAAQLGLEEQYTSQIVVADKWLNRTQKPKDTTEDIQQRVCWYLEIQAKEKEAAAFKQQKIEMAKFLCESLSAGLVTPVTFAEMENKIDQLDLAALKTYIENEVSRRKEREERAKEEAERRLLEQQERERIAAEKVENERIRKEQEAEARRISAEQEAIKQQEEEARQIVEVAAEIVPAEIIEPVVESTLLNAQFVVYGVVDIQVNSIIEFLRNNNIKFKSAIKLAE